MDPEAFDLFKSFAALTEKVAGQPGSVVPSRLVPAGEARSHVGAQDAIAAETPGAKRPVGVLQALRNDASALRKVQSSHALEVDLTTAKTFLARGQTCKRPPGPDSMCSQEQWLDVVGAA
eukprot:Skav214307  [mRNA]  locus=scaffold998:72016:74815:+ [translate_table: standard]